MRIPANYQEEVFSRSDLIAVSGLFQDMPRYGHFMTFLLCGTSYKHTNSLLKSLIISIFVFFGLEKFRFCKLSNFSVMRYLINSALRRTVLAAGVIILIGFLLFSCSDKEEEKDLSGTCYVQLFDGDRFKGDNVIVYGPGEFASLVSLPGSTKNWDDEADSFKSGETTTVVFWFQPNFAGDSVVYTNGAEKSSMEEPRSMKIRCN